MGGAGGRNATDDGERRALLLGKQHRRQTASAMSSCDTPMSGGVLA